MTARWACVCDMCGETSLPVKSDAMPSGVPDGWHQVLGLDLCSLDCLIAAACNERSRVRYRRALIQQRKLTELLGRIK